MPERGSRNRNRARFVRPQARARVGAREISHALRFSCYRPSDGGGEAARQLGIHPYAKTSLKTTELERATDVDEER
jgi:hypothetical protein